MINNLNNDNRLLDINNLEISQERESLAYLVDTRESQGNFGEFLIFSFKDCNSNRITGTLGNQEDFFKSGEIAIRMKSKPVKIRYIVREYNGGFSLKIQHIEVIDPIKENFPLASFIGKYNKANDDLTVVERIISEIFKETFSFGELRSKYTTTSLPGIYNGLSGGYSLLISSVFFDIYTKKDVIGIDVRLLVQVFIATTEMYFRYLVHGNTAGVVRDADKVAFLANAGQKHKENLNLYFPVVSCLMGLYSNQEPTNLYAYIVYNSFKSNIKILNLATAHSTMIKGGTRYIGDVKLIRD